MIQFSMSCFEVLFSVPGFFSYFCILCRIKVKRRCMTFNLHRKLRFPEQILMVHIDVFQGQDTILNVTLYIYFHRRMGPVYCVEHTHCWPILPESQIHARIPAHSTKYFDKQITKMVSPESSLTDFAL